jgi:hypothetical protein
VLYTAVRTFETRLFGWYFYLSLTWPLTLLAISAQSPIITDAHVIVKWRDICPLLYRRNCTATWPPSGIHVPCNDGSGQAVVPVDNNTIIPVYYFVCVALSCLLFRAPRQWNSLSDKFVEHDGVCWQTPFAFAQDSEICRPGEEKEIHRQMTYSAYKCSRMINIILHNITFVQLLLLHNNQ